MSNKIEFQIGSDESIQLNSPEGVFTPTGTTSAIIDAFKQLTDEPVEVLDLGCGNGVVGLVLDKLGLVKQPLYASDVSENAVVTTIENAKLQGCEVEARAGSIFEPWAGMKFQYIVNDISGIAKEIAEKSDWFKFVPCESGPDGTDLVVEMLQQAGEYLRPEGTLIFPVISLSNVDRLIECAESNFTSVTRLHRAEWPLPPSLVGEKEKLDELKEKGFVNFERKFGMTICYTEVYAAKGPK